MEKYGTPNADISLKESCDTFRSLHRQHWHPFHHLTLIRPPLQTFSFYRLKVPAEYRYLPTPNDLHRYERRELQRSSICYILVNLMCLATELRLLKQHHLCRDMKGSVIKRNNQWQNALHASPITLNRDSPSAQKDLIALHFPSLFTLQ